MKQFDAALTPTPFFEGNYDQRREYPRELLSGKVLCWFDRTDRSKTGVRDISAEFSIQYCPSQTPYSPSEGEEYVVR